ncbi:MAG TPA: hypothetical protein VKP30_10285, partial [Polyangiaceae bacterium]|nr:hypothetical protein [Polyangiaceae bacterium]
MLAGRCRRWVGYAMGCCILSWQGGRSCFGSNRRNVSRRGCIGLLCRDVFYFWSVFLRRFG